MIEFVDPVKTGDTTRWQIAGGGAAEYICSTNIPPKHPLEPVASVLLSLHGKYHTCQSVTEYTPKVAAKSLVALAEREFSFAGERLERCQEMLAAAKAWEARCPK